MHAIATALLLLLGVAGSGFLVRLLPAGLPLPIVQIAVGAALAFFIHFDVLLDPEILFLLFVPPLLFLDGWRIPKDAFFRDLRPILTLAIGLVAFTVAGTGLLIGWLFPALPMSMAFALAGTLSPTDPVAVSGIVSRSPLPPRLMHLLEGESLLNDVSGLVVLRFAVAAALTGSFSPLVASGTFVLVAAGGVAVGVGVAFGIGAANRWLVKRTTEDPGVPLLVTVLVPFAAYLAAERLHVSGILAAATAGIAMQYVDRIGRPLPATRLHRDSVWNALQMALNGSMFVMLGGQLPHVLQGAGSIARAAGMATAWLLLACVVAITLAMVALRFAWACLSLWLTLFRGDRSIDRRRGSFLRLAGLTAFAGVRGAVTLAGVLALPLLMPDGASFPGRDLAISVAMGVILLSLTMASLTLPALAAGLEFDPAQAAAANHRELDAQNAAAEAAIRRVEELRRDSPEVRDDPEAAMRIVEYYRRRVRLGRAAEGERAAARSTLEVERRLRIEAIRAERDELRRLSMARKIDDATARRMMRRLDLMEAAASRPAED